jgi:hypothetical protein
MQSSNPNNDFTAEESEGSSKTGFPARSNWKIFLEDYPILKGKR